jgi:hypothetical protein
MRYYTNMTEQLPVTSFLAETTHQITVMADNLGYGERFVPRLIDVMMTENGLGPRAKPGRPERPRERGEAKARRARSGEPGEVTQ